MAGLVMRFAARLLIVVLIAASCGGSDAAPSTSVTSAAPSGNSDPCTVIPVAATRSETTEVDGETRDYRVHIPDGLVAGTASPAVFDFHGAGSSAEQQVTVSAFETLADQEGFIVVTPDALDRRWAPTDAAYVEQLLDSLEATQCIDADRVFATGMSNGGFFSARLMCDLADRFAAIGTVTGIWYPPCAPTEPVPIIHFHGLDDEIVTFDGIPAAIQEWSDAMDCTAEPAVTTVTASVELRSYRQCAGDGAIDFYVIDDAGHTWPGSATTAALSSRLGETNMEIDATELIWDWFTSATADAG